MSFPAAEARVAAGSLNLVIDADVAVSGGSDGARVALALDAGVDAVRGRVRVNDESRTRDDGIGGDMVASGDTVGTLVRACWYGVGSP